jgi:protein subunit release factor A
MTFADSRLDPDKLRIDVYVYEGATPLLVRVTHLPTGLSAEATGGSQDAAKAAALERLRSALGEQPGT